MANLRVGGVSPSAGGARIFAGGISASVQTALRAGAQGAPAASGSGAVRPFAVRASGGGQAAGTGHAAAFLTLRAGGTGPSIGGARIAGIGISAAVAFALRVSAQGGGAGTGVTAAARFTLRAGAQGVPGALGSGAVRPFAIRAGAGGTGAVSGSVAPRVTLLASAAFRNIAAKVRYGLGKAALHLGQPWTQYRPQSPWNPISLPNQIGVVQVAVDTAARLTFVQPSKYKAEQWYAAFDATTTQVGDYFTDLAGVVWFVATLEPFKAPSLVRCNRVLSIFATPSAAGFGATGYGGDIRSQEPARLANWPASAIQGARATVGPDKLAGDAQEGQFDMLFPQFAATIVERNDRIRDDLGAAYIVKVSELTPLGWRLLAELAES